MSAPASWWQTTTIYQVYPRSFCDTNGDGIGDLPGIIAKLDYIKELGIETVWISPFFASPQVDFGYDITDYLSVAPEYGDLADVERLIDEAHRRNLKVMFDLVMNHTSDQHPWFAESRSSCTNARHDWYIWADGKGWRKPNNWRSAAQITSAWNYDATRGQYYLASFLPCQPDLNYHNPAVKAAMFDAVRFWLRKGVDGFRLDMFGSIMKDRALRNNPLSLRPVGGLPGVPLIAPKYTMNTDASFEFARELRAVCDEFTEPERILLGEVFGDAPVLRRYLGERRDGLQLVFLFDFLRYRYDAAFFRGHVAAYERAFPFPDQPTYVLGNHDRTRPLTRLGGALDKARVLALLLLTLRGVPTIYMGDEIGMTNTPIPLRDAQDVMAKTFQRLPQPAFRLLERWLGETINRDEVRTPMQWDASRHAGFCPEDARPWLPVHANKLTRSVAAQVNDTDSLLTLYRRLLALRKTTPALHVGSLALLDGPPDVLTYVRAHEQERLAVHLNFSEQAQRVACRDAAALLLATDRRVQLGAGALALVPHSGAIVRLRAT